MPEITINSGTPAEDQAHVDAMVAKADAGVDPNAKPQAAPTDGKSGEADLAGFKSQEDLVKAYNELRAKMSREGAPKAEEPAPATEQPKPEEATREQANEAAKAAGVDMAALESEFLQNGGLSDETYKNLEKAGFGRETVDAYIAGQQALADQMQARIEEHVGGADKLEAALEWAKSGLSREEQVAFNNTVDTADEAGIKLALDGLMAKFANAEGSEPSLIGGSTTGNGGSVFRSTAELTAAMRDPRYQTDPAYRADVEQRLARSSIF